MSRKERKRNRKLRTKPKRKSGFDKLCWDIAKSITKQRKIIDLRMRWDSQTKQNYCLTVVGTLAWCKSCYYKNGCLKGDEYV